MYKVLIFGMTENPGGVERFIINNYRNINKEKIHFDFLCNTYNKIAYEDEILRGGSKIFHVYPRRKNPFKFRKELNRFFKIYGKNYNCIWVNLNTLVNIDYLKAAKKYGIRRLIVHSHSAENMDRGLKGYITEIMHKFHRTEISNIATDYWACSLKAAKWFYPKSNISKVKIIKNAIDVKNFEFRVSKRKKIRSKYNLMNKFVIGNVGRLHFEKNQIFALRILNELRDSDDRFRLIFVGQGPDLEKLKYESQKLGLGDKVIFAGVQHDIQGWLSSFDLFLFPSLFEGLGIAGLEAQANGVPVIASKTVIPQELEINKNFKFLDLKKGAKYWAKIINNLHKNDLIRLDNKSIECNFKENGFDIKTSALYVQKLLLKDNK